MSDSEVNDLAHYTRQQEIAGEEIVRKARNFKKDGEERKTRSYLESRLEGLERNWDQFDKTDTIIREEFSQQLEHPYFKKDYYEGIRKVAEQLRNEIVLRLNASNSEESEDVGARGGATGAIPKAADRPIATPKHVIVKEATEIQTKVTPRTMATRERFQLLIDILQKSLEKCSLEFQQRRSEQFCVIKQRTIQQNWDEISAIYMRMEDHVTTDDVVTYFDMQERVEKALLDLCEDINTTRPTAVTNNPTMKLPKIELPKFDGEYLNWRQFYDLFKQLIHDQPIAPAQKLYFLRANVTGEAHRLIQHFPATDHNYEVAWETLVDRYDNKRLLLTAQLSRLLGQSSSTGTAASLRKLHDTTKEALQAVTNLGFKVDGWDPLIVHLMLQKMDKESRTLFEQSLDDPRCSPTIKSFYKFVESRFQTLEAISSRDERKRQSVVVVSNPVDRLNCAVCNSDDERDNLVRRLQLCRNCLKAGHYSQSCQSRGCQKCDGKHNTLLHKPKIQRQAGHHPKGRQQQSPSQRQQFKRAETAADNQQQQITTEEASQNVHVGKPSQNINNSGDRSVGLPSTSATAAGHATKRRQVYLATAVVNVISSYGTRVPCRVLLDFGSQLHFVTAAFAQELGVKKRRMNIPISGIGAQECKAEFNATITFESRTSSYKATIEAGVLHRISDYQPSHEVDMPLWNIPSGIQLADPAFAKAPRIDMLLGADIFFELLIPGEFKVSNDLPILRNTSLGWIVAGSSAPVSDMSNGMSHSYSHIATKPSLNALDKLVRSFWETEGHDTPVNTMSEEEHECEEHFKNNTTVIANGQFMVKLPLKGEPGLLLGESREIARKRFLSLEKRLDKDKQLKELYTEFIDEYVSLGHMNPISENMIPKVHYILPHHCVMKPESSTTKLRVVFDASARTTSGRSLNDILMVGPTVQPDLFSIIADFRTHRYAFTGDISKMYRQVLVSPEYRALQMILWRSQHDHPVQTYQLNTLTYGTASASYLATKCLQKLADDNMTRYSKASTVIKSNVYVDDFLTGAETLEEAKELLEEIILLLKSRHFELRKFCANDPLILEKIPEEHKEKLVSFQQSKGIKTLGLIWDPVFDCFKYSFEVDKPERLETRICKRTVLADLARLFDPLGLLGPVIVLGKLFLQELWKTSLSWDDHLSEDQFNKWHNYMDQFSLLNDLRIPRHALMPSAKVIELHAFSDASLSAFGVCVYIRSIDDDGNIHSQLLCSKSRVGPLKATTIARLELQGAVLMVELVEKLLRVLSKKIDRVYYYTDSTTVLAWIKSPSYTWETYVANRIAKIQTVSDVQQWNYIKGDQNPADIISRGLTPAALIQSTIWFNGPSFLCQDEESWTKTSYPVPEEVPGVRKSKSVLAAGLSSNTDIVASVNHGNSFYTLQKIFSFCYRFYSNIRRPKSLRNTGRLSVEELQQGSRLLFTSTQRTAFSEDYQELLECKILNKGSRISSLSPYMDKDSKLIRVGGRLKNAQISPDAKHQILMPKNNIVTKLLLTHLHEKYMHASHRSLVAISRQRYWILSVGRLARQVIGNCVKCFRSKPKTIEQLMGNLPSERVNPSRPFFHSGVDFCGPVRTHHRIRGKTPTKSYLAVFVCFSTRAVHIEVVGDLTSEAFINALKRFIGRRGVCHSIFCDNATNFVGAKNELTDLKRIFQSQQTQSAIEASCLQDGIHWRYIPPRSPHFGGLWEAAVKSAKGLLIRFLGEASLTYEQLLTAVIQVEAILNSRPLTPMSADPNDLEALTPGHFLIGAPLTALPEPDVTDFKLSNLTKFRQIQHIQQHFWKRWSAEYLHLLQQRMKWKSESHNLQPGTLVVIKEANIPPMRWKLGRVTEVIKGNDNLVRVANVKTQGGTYQRAVHNLCPLPIENSNAEENDRGLEPSPAMQGVDPKNPQAYTKTRHRSKNLPKFGLFSTILFILLAVPANLAQVNDQVAVKKLDDAIGIYFEDIGRVQLVNTFWSIYIYYNLTAYWHEFGEIKSYLELLDAFCEKQTSNQIYCRPIADTLRHRVAAIEHNNELLHSLHGPKHERIRMARSPFDIVGTLANSLFGVLDQEDAKRIDEQISSVKENERHMTELLQKQSSIADSTVNILKRNTLEIQQEFKALNMYLAKTIDAIQAKQQSTELRHNLLSLTSYLVLIITNFENVQEVFLDVMLDLHHAKINPQLITPKQFKEQLQLIGNNLPSTLRLPQGTIVDMYRMSSVKGRSLNDSLVFEMRIPLINNEEFQVFNLIDVPILHGNASYLVEISAPYLAVSLARDKFFELTEVELASCKLVTPRNYLCTQMHPTNTQRGMLNGCAMDLLNHAQSALSECVLKPATAHDQWKTLRDSNGWIFSVISSTTGHLICEGSTRSVAISGNGLMEFQKPCVLKLPNTIINGRIAYNNTISNSFIPSANISNWIFSRNEAAATSVPPEVHDIDKAEIDDLKSRIDDLIKQTKALPPPSTISAHDYHHYGLLYFLLAGMIGMAGVWCYHRRKPKPAPRQQRFEVNV